MSSAHEDLSSSNSSLNSWHSGLISETTPLRTTVSKTRSPKTLNDVSKCCIEGFSSSPNAILPNSSTTNRTPPNQTAANPSSTSSSPGPFCRICHDVDTKEALISPCNCSGTMGLVHASCIEKWLSSANSDICELCRFKYSITRCPQPAYYWFLTPETPRDLRNLLGDSVCFCLLTPLALVSACLCGLGAVNYLQKAGATWEAAGLIALSVFLLSVYSLWISVTIRYHIRVFNKWRASNQVVHLVDLKRLQTQDLPPNT